MDQQLLNALNNLSESLDMIVEALNSKEKKDSSSVSKALAEGDFTKQMEEMSVGIQSIKSDTEEILKNQQTIMSMSKESEKTSKFKEVGEDKETQKNIGKGISTILLISGAVIAIGLAFSLVGDVDVLSVMSLGLAMVAISYSFSKVAESTEGMSLGDIALTASSLVIMSAAISVSSYILDTIQEISLKKAMSAILIGGMFATLGYSIGKIVGSFKNVGLSDIIIASLAMPIVLPALAFGIAGASYGLSLVQGVSLGQWASSLLVSSIVVVASYAIGNILEGLGNVSIDKMLTASVALPLILTGMAFGIAGASYGLSMVQNITLNQWVSSLLVSSVLVAISLGMVYVLKKMNDVKASSVVKLPIFTTLMSASIMLSSHRLKKSEVLDDNQIGSIAKVALIISGATLVLTPTFKALDNVGIGTIIKGGVAILAIATTVMLSSHILNAGNYSDYPDVSWSLGVGLSLVTFGLAGIALGALVFGPQALIFASGLGAVLGVAATIAAVSHILKSGKYDNDGMLEWATSTALLYATFTPILLVLGAVGMASSVMGLFGVNPWEKAKQMMIGIADTIVAVSFRLQTGSYKGGPDKDWAEGIGIAIGAFSPVYGMLVANNIMSVFGGGVSPDDFKKAILTITDGIITVANKLNENNAAFKGGPDKDWAEGVGLSIAAFAPVYSMLLENDSLFGSDVSPEDFNEAILTVTDGIIAVADKLNKNNSVFEGGPTKDWAEGVGGAIGAFSIVFDTMSSESGLFTSSKEVVNNMVFGISKIVDSIVDTSNKLGKGNFNTTINKEFVSGLSSGVKEYIQLAKYLEEQSDDNDAVYEAIYGDDPIRRVTTGIDLLASSYNKLGSSLDKVGNSLSQLNLDKLRELNNQNVSFSNNIQTVESSGGGMLDKMKSTIDNASDSVTGNSVKVPSNIGVNNNLGKGGKTVAQQLDEVIKLLSNINVSTSTIDEYIEELTDGELKSEDLK